MATTPTPTVTNVVPQNFVIEALKGPTNPHGLLDRFPDEVYNKAPESHFMRFMYVLLGPAGVGDLRKDYLLARAALEAHGLETFDLDAFYGNPLQFGRILSELFTDDVDGLIDRDTWEKIKAQDARYRTRAMDFLGGVRLGNTAAGMQLVAKSGLGHNVEIVENYKYFYDIHSDDVLGYKYYGQTTSTEEFVILPRQDVSQSAVQTVTITGDPTGGYFVLFFNGLPSLNIPFDAPNRSHYDNVYDGSQNLISSTLVTQGMQEALEAIPTIGEGQVQVEGGPPNAYVVTFTGALSSREVPTFVVENHLTGGSTPLVTVSNVQGGVDGADEIVEIPPRDVYHLQQAIDRIRPVNTLPTVVPAASTRSRQVWASVSATSSYQEVLRYVTGNPSISWPAPDSRHWIVSGVETEAPRPFGDLSQHYIGFHNVVNVAAIGDDAQISERVGRFGEQADMFPFLRNYTDPTAHFTADKALADYPEQPLPTTDNTILSIYPADYVSLPGVPQIKYKDEQFWSSLDRTSGSEYLSIDLGEPQAVNYIAFEVTRKPLEISIFYDTLDQAFPAFRFTEVTPEVGFNFPDVIHFDSQAQVPWNFVEYHFGNVKGELIFTRYIQIKFERQSSEFLLDARRNISYPWSVDVRNFRIGRNVDPR